MFLINVYNSPYVFSCFFAFINMSYVKCLFPLCSSMYPFILLIIRYRDFKGTMKCLTKRGEMSAKNA